tara:strand:+ start:172 stop:1272 length:1101 start_codon:yes stop_codon:yes gene_type:complete
MSNIRTQIRRDPAATWTAADITLAAGEMACESDTGKIKVGDGTNKWTKLDYAATTIPLPWGGASYGFSVGGQTPGTPWTSGSNIIQRYSFASDGDATDYKDLASAGVYTSSVSDTKNNNIYTTSSGTGTGTEKWSVSNATTAVSSPVVNLSSKYGGTSAFSTVNGTGYFAGGFTVPNSASIDKFATASEGTCTDVGDLLHNYMARVSGSAYSLEAAYATGSYPGLSGAGGSKQIHKWTFATDGNATDVGDVSYNNGTADGAYGIQSSYGPTHGYFTGVSAGITSNKEIHSFSFASEGDTTDGGDLDTHVAMGGGAATSTTHGYTAGGYGSVGTTRIQKFSTTGATATGTNVGDLALGMFHGGGTHG